MSLDGIIVFASGVLASLVAAFLFKWWERYASSRSENIRLRRRERELLEYRKIKNFVANPSVYVANIVMGYVIGAFLIIMPGIMYNLTVLLEIHSKVFPDSHSDLFFFRNPTQWDYFILTGIRFAITVFALLGTISIVKTSWTQSRVRNFKQYQKAVREKFQTDE